MQIGDLFYMHSGLHVLVLRLNVDQGKPLCRFFVHGKAQQDRCVSRRELDDNGAQLVGKKCILHHWPESMRKKVLCQ